MKLLLKSAIVSSVIFLTGCASSMMPAGGTDTAVAAELCRQWGDSLPTRSRSDTSQTQDEIQSAYASFSLACPGWAHLVP